MINSFWPWKRMVGRIPSPVQHWGREHYVPLRPHELIAELTNISFEAGRDAMPLKILFQQLVALVHQQYRSHHEQLVLLYTQFDPDLDLTPIQLESPRSIDDAERDALCRELFSKIGDSLHYKNYRRLKPREIQEALNTASHWGVRLKIRFSSLRRLGAIKFFSSFLLVIAIVIASLFYGIKSAFSYTSTKRRYQLDVARNLYYKNLDNNLGALLRLVDEAKQQEVCEVILAFYILSSSTSEFQTTEQIDMQAESLLRTLTGIEIDFDVKDALRDLVGLGVVHSNADGWKSLGVEDAFERISENRNQHR